MLYFFGVDHLHCYFLWYSQFIGRPSSCMTFFFFFLMFLFLPLCFPLLFLFNLLSSSALTQKLETAERTIGQLRSNSQTQPSTPKLTIRAPSADVSPSAAARVQSPRLRNRILIETGNGSPTTAKSTDSSTKRRCIVPSSRVLQGHVCRLLVLLLL